MLSRLTYGFVLCMLMGSVQNSFAQRDESGMIYDKCFLYGIAFQTSGFGFHTRYTSNKTFDIRKQFDIDWVASMKHPREITIRETGVRSYVFGKLNEFSILRATYGRQRILADYQRNIDVRVNVHYSIGPNIGILKPVYLDIFQDAFDEFEAEAYDPEKHSQADIRGGSRWNEGMGDLKFRMGTSAKLGLSFEWNRQNEKFKALETGIMVDIYHQRVPIMAFVENDFAYVNFYVAILFGNQW